MTLPDEHTNCSLLEDRQRAMMSRTGLRPNDNLKRKADQVVTLGPKSLKLSSRPSNWLYREFLTLIQYRDGFSVTLYGESFRLQTMRSRSIATIRSNSNCPSLST